MDLTLAIVLIVVAVILGAIIGVALTFLIPVFKVKKANKLPYTYTKNYKWRCKLGVL